MSPAPPVRGSRRGRWAVACVLAAALAGCGAPGPLIPEQQDAAGRGAAPPPAPTVYRVEPGDTLYSIAFRYGLDWRRVAAWNAIGAPYTIHAGDPIRLRPPPDMRPAVAGTGGRSGRSGATGGSERAPASRPEPAPEPREAREQAADPPADPEPAPSPPAPQPEPATAGADDIPEASTRLVAGVRWRWPTEGRVSRPYDDSAARKGILIAGDEGQDVRAAADGQVVYSGDGLIGYGQLIIIKHSDRMLSAYAHNRERLVREGDRVRAGQRIGRMGRNERDAAVLHFEVRRDGKPDDPADYLPGR